MKEYGILPLVDTIENRIKYCLHTTNEPSICNMTNNLLFFFGMKRQIKFIALIKINLVRIRALSSFIYQK